MGSGWKIAGTDTCGYPPACTRTGDGSPSRRATRTTSAKGEPSRGTTASTGSGQASAGPAGAFQDLGRFAVTGRPEDQGAFKTPTLREIARTAPYMHDGTFSTLNEVLNYYDRGGNKDPFLDGELRPLNLIADEKQALLEFLRSLSGDISEGPNAVADVK